MHPTGKAQLTLSVQTQGQGHETTFAQIVAQELGIPPEDVEVIHGDTDNTPFGLGTYGSRSTPVSGAAAAVVARKVRDRARIIAAADARGLARGPRVGAAARWYVKGDPEQGATIQEIAMLAHGALELPEGVEGHLDASVVYDPPNLTYPVRRLHLRRRRRPGHRAGQGAPLRRGRRLRPADQPDDRRGPGARRAGRRRRAWR